MDASSTPPPSRLPPPAPGATRPFLAFGRAGRATLVIAFAVLLCLPRLSHLIRLPLGSDVSENRALAAAPGWPKSRTDMETFAARASAYLADHFGLRGALVELDGWLRYRVFGDFLSDEVILGRHKRVFLTSHEAGVPFSNIDRICGVGISDAEFESIAGGIARMLDAANPVAARSAYVSVPTAPLIYPEDLPDWVARRCAAHQPMAPRVRAALASARPDLVGRMISPDAAERAAKADGFAYLPWDFHWSGLAARSVTRAISEQDLGLPRLREIPFAIEREPSDLSALTAGMRHFDQAWEPRPAAAGLAFCHIIGGTCDPAFAGSARALREMSVAHRPGGTGPRLLILGDSFGQQAANYFGEYFDDVVFLNLAFERVLTPGELETLGASIATRGRPDFFLLLFHDVALGVDLTDVIKSIGRGEADGSIAKDAPRPR
jgi:hypothetical protein